MIKINATITSVPFANPTASNKIPDKDGPTNEPSEYIEVHRLEICP